MQLKRFQERVLGEVKIFLERLATQRTDGNEPIQRSLFDFVADDLNDYEKSVALCLDHHAEVLWWYRNLVGPEHFSIQGYKRNRIYPVRCRVSQISPG